MKIRLLLLALLLVVNGFSFPTQDRRDDRKSFVITRVTVIDGTGSKPRPGMDVLVLEGKIAAIGKNIPVSPGTQQVEGTGKFLIPGLWDMHVHCYDKTELSLLIANGITGARIMFGAPEYLQWRADIAAGTLQGPQLVVGSPLVDGPNPTWPGSLAIKNAEEARQAVRSIAKDGYDFVKVYGGLPRDAYFALVEEAGKQHIPFAGHVPDGITPIEASDAGQRSMEHLYNLIPACSTLETTLREEARQQQLPWGNLVFTKGQQILDTYSEEKAAILFARFRRKRIWQCPTLTQSRGAGFSGEPELANDPRLQYLPVGIRQGWGSRTLPANMTAWLRRMHEKKKQMVARMQRDGVKLLAGTDVPNPYCLPGFGLHDELGLLVEAGLTPQQALQTAMCNPAQFLGRDKEMGTIQKGKRADLVLLDADPLMDIHNTTKIHAVVLNGRLFDRARLDKMLADVAAAAKAP